MKCNKIKLPSQKKKKKIKNRKIIHIKQKLNEIQERIDNIIFDVEIRIYDERDL